MYLFDIDDLERVVQDNLSERQKEADAAMSVIELEVAEYRKWLLAQRVVPTIRSLRDRFHQVAAAEAERCLKAVQSARGPAEVEQAVRRMSELIANKLLHTPMSALKSSERGDVDQMVAVTSKLFGLEEDKQEPGDRRPETGNREQAEEKP
jgi:glutamyl-tRNA reductase